MAVLGDLRVSIGAEIQGFTRAMDRVERRIQKVESRFEGLSRIGGRLRGLGTRITAGIGLPLAGVGTIAIKTSADFQRSMNRVRALTEATGQEFAQLRDLAIEQGRTTIFSATESAQAMGFLAQAGLDVGQVLQALPGALQLAAAGGIDLASAADIATNVLAGMQLGVEDLSSVNDRLALTASRANTNVFEMGEAFAKVGPIASNSGQSLSDVAAALGALANQGIKGAEAGTAVRRVITALTGPTAGARRALSDLGVTLLDANDQIRPLPDLIGEFQRAQARLGDQTQFTARLIEIFGQRAGPAMAALISSGEDAIRSLSDSIRESDGFAQRFADTANQGVPKGLAEMQAAIETLGITIGEKLAPEILSAIEGVKSFVDGLSEADRETLKTAGAVAGIGLAFGAATLAAGLLAGAISAIASAAAFLAPALPFVGIAVGAAAAVAGVLKLADVFSDSEKKAAGLNRRMLDLEDRLRNVGAIGAEAGEAIREALALESAAEDDAASEKVRRIADAFAEGTKAAVEFVQARDRALALGQQPPQRPDRRRPTGEQVGPFPLFEKLTKDQVAFNEAVRQTIDEVTELNEGFRQAERVAPRALELMRFQAGQFVQSAETLTSSTLDGAEAFRQLQMAAVDLAAPTRDAAIALDSVNRKLAEIEGARPRVSAEPSGLLERPALESLEAIQGRFEEFLGGLSGASAEARAELEQLVQVFESGRFENLALEPKQLERVRDLLKDRLGFDELGAAIDPIEAKIQRIAKTLQTGIATSKHFEALGIPARTEELDQMRRTLEELELSNEFGIQLDETEEQIRRMQQTLETGLLPISGEQATLRALEQIRTKLTELVLDEFRDDIAAAQGDAEALEQVWQRIQARLQAIGAMQQIGPKIEAEIDDLKPAADDTAAVPKLAAALQALLPIFSALQSATSRWLIDLVEGTKTAAEAAREWGRAMVRALVDVTARLAVAAALAAIVAIPFGGTQAGLVFSQLSGVRAIGGSVSKDEPYLVGERGPEVFVPHRSGFILPNHQIEQRQEGGPVQQGRPFLVGEQGPELFVPQMRAGLAPSAPEPQRQQFEARPTQLQPAQQGPTALEQVLRVEVALDDAGLLRQVGDVQSALAEQLQPEELALQIQPTLVEGIGGQLEDLLGQVERGLEGIGGQIEADAAQQFERIPRVIDGIRRDNSEAVDRIRGEGRDLGETREQMASESAASSAQQIETNLDTQDVLDTVQVDLGNAVDAINVAAAAALAAASLDLIPLLAEGGPISAGQMAVVGERGPELFRPRVGGEVVSNRESRRMLRGGGPPPLADSVAGPAAAGSSLPPAARAAGSALSTVPKRSGQVEGLRGLAGGGVVERGETVLVGEFGPELFLTNVPVFEGWYPKTYREWLGDEKSVTSKQFLHGAKWILQLPDLAAEAISQGGPFAHEDSEKKQRRVESAKDFRNQFLQKLTEKRPPVHETFPVGGTLYDLESAAFRFAPLNLPSIDLSDAIGQSVPDIIADIPADPDAPSAGGRSVPRRALGGPVMAGQPFLVGERGPELFVPDVMGQIMSASQTSRLARTDSPSMLESRFPAIPETAQERGPIQVHVNLGGSDQTVVTVRDWDEFARELGSRIETVSRDYVSFGGR